MICKFDFDFHVFQCLKALVAKNDHACPIAKKKQFVTVNLLWQNYIVIISLNETIEKNVPFVAKMMAKIRNISTIKPPVVLRLPIWAMFFCKAVYSTRQAREYILSIFSRLL